METRKRHPYRWGRNSSRTGGNDATPQPKPTTITTVAGDVCVIYFVIYCPSPMLKRSGQGGCESNSCWGVRMEGYHNMEFLHIESFKNGLHGSALEQDMKQLRLENRCVAIFHSHIMVFVDCMYNCFRYNPTSPLSVHMYTRGTQSVVWALPNLKAHHHGVPAASPLEAPTNLLIRTLTLFCGERTSILSSRGTCICRFWTNEGVFLLSPAASPARSPHQPGGGALELAVLPFACSC